MLGRASHGVRKNVRPATKFFRRWWTNPSRERVRIIGRVRRDPSMKPAEIGEDFQAGASHSCVDPGELSGILLRHFPGACWQFESVFGATVTLGVAVAVDRAKTVLRAVPRQKCYLCIPC